MQKVEKINILKTMPRIKMQVEIFKANDTNDLKKRIESFCSEGHYIQQVKFEDFGTNGRKLLVYYNDEQISIKQEIIVLKKTITGTIIFLNKVLDVNASCVDTTSTNVNELMAIVVKNK